MHHCGRSCYMDLSGRQGIGRSPCSNVSLLLGNLALMDIKAECRNQRKAKENRRNREVSLAAISAG